MSELKEISHFLCKSCLRQVRIAVYTAVFLTAILTGRLAAQDEPSSPDEPGFGLGAVEVGLGIAPLGLTSENDLDVIVEYGGFVSFITRNPGGFMLRISGTHGSSQVNAPAEFLSGGPVSLSRFDASIMYGDYFYGGAGIGVALLSHSLGDQALAEFSTRGQTAEESFENTTYYVFRFGVRSEGTLGYFVEGVLTLMQPQVNASVTDIPTGISATSSQRFNMNIFHFFHLGLVYRF